MEVYLVDGTYELFRAYFALPPLESPTGEPVGAVHGLIQSLLRLMRENGVTHIGCAFDSVIPSFRNELFLGYKTGEGNAAGACWPSSRLRSGRLRRWGVCVWPMVEFEADDAIATAAQQLRRDPAVERIIICSPDKDLAQLVEGERVVCLDRRPSTGSGGRIVGEDAVIAKYGVAPPSIPDLLALTGDAADGIPGLPRWGAKSTATVLSRYGHLEDIPTNAPWDVPVRGAAALQGILSQEYEKALLYRQLATLRRDVPIDAAPDAVRWRGACRAEYEALCRELGSERLATLPHQWARAIAYGCWRIGRGC